MIPKENRATKKIIDLIFQKGNSVKSPNIVLKFYLNKGSGERRVSFSVPKSLISKATKRNILRRRGYFVIREYLDSLPEGFMGLFIFRNKSKEVFNFRGKNKTKALKSLQKEIKIIIDQIENIKNE
jgi:ribonuclease P protein component